MIGLFSSQAIADDTSENLKPNGNYRYIEFGLAKTIEANPVCSGINSNECYKTLRGSELTASLQFLSLPNLLISASSSSQGATGTNYNFTSSVGKLLIGLIGGFGPVDALVSISSISADVLSCPIGNNNCQIILENGTDYGAMAKLWLGSEKNYNIGVTLDRYSYAPSSAKISTSIFATWLPALHHSISVSLNSDMDISGTSISTGSSLSYAYLF
jgi:hypothetical protein